MLLGEVDCNIHPSIPFLPYRRKNRKKSYRNIRPYHPFHPFRRCIQLLLRSKFRSMFDLLLDSLSQMDECIAQAMHTMNIQQNRCIHIHLYLLQERLLQNCFLQANCMLQGSILCQGRMLCQDRMLGQDKLLQDNRCLQD